MRQFVTIAANAFLELIRQPVFLLLATGSALFIMFLATPYYFAFGDEPKLVKNSTLAVMLLSGLFGAVLSASASLAREIHRGTALAVLSKPVGRARFVLAKFSGVAGALVILVYVNLVAALLTSRMAFDAYGSTDLFALGIFTLGILLAYLLGGLSNFFLRRPFVSDAVLSLVVMLTLAFVVINFFNQHAMAQSFAEGVDWNMVPAGLLVLFAIWIFAGLALACSTRLEMIPTLAICSGFFLAGIMSDYLFGRPAAAGHWWGSVLYTVLPNWQLFWLADAVASGKSAFQWGYVGKALAYAALYLGAVLSVAVVLFEDRELS
jgi:ABC-type transport system involved in multi-copper enzyme maturation permease subunit